MIFGQTAKAEAAGAAARTGRATRGAGAGPHGARGPVRALAGRAELSRGATLALGLALVWGVIALLTLWQGSLTINLHEGDASHLAAIVLRMAEGEWPHLDFMTPLGIGALAPIAALVAAGEGLGTAYLGAQAAMAALLLPALWWTGMTRLGGGWLALGFGAFVLALTMAHVHGGAEAYVSVSMHYNRWAWAVSYVVLALLILPGARRAPRLEGAMLGIGFAWLALTKATYFAGLAPVALVALALRRDGPGLSWSLGASLAVALAVTAAAGPAFWPAYLGDLLAVATSEARPSPGLSFTEVLSAPTHLAATLVLLAAVVILRRSVHKTEGTILMAAIPGLALITWQNFGNDPQWLPLLAFTLAALRPAGPAGQPYLAAALVAAALALPSALNVATSPARQMAALSEDSVPLMPARPEHDDFRIAAKRAEKVLVRVPGPGFADPPEPTFWGATLPRCELRHGGVRTDVATVEEVAEAGFAGRRAFVADTMQALWLFGDLARLPGGAPWYYDGLPGGDAAEIVIVPLCPTGTAARDRAFAAVQAASLTVTEVFRGTHAVVLEVHHP